MFKIKSDDQKAKALRRIHQFEKDIQKVRAVKGAKAGAWFQKTYGSHVRELTQQLKHYKQLKENGLPALQESDLTRLGAYLVDARIASDVTQGQLAKKLGVSQPMVFKYENAEYEGCGTEIIEGVIEALDLELRVDLKKSRHGSRTIAHTSGQMSADFRSRLDADRFFGQLAGAVHV